MCEPITIGALAVAGMGLTAVGGIQQAQQQKAAGKAQGAYYDYLAGQADQEAALALKKGESDANLAQDQGAFESQKVSRQARQMEGTQKMALASNGVGGGSVTSADVLNDTFDKTKLDQMTVRYNADRQSYEANEKAKYDAWNATNQANMYRFAGDNARKQGKAQAKATLFNTATAVIGEGLATFGPMAVAKMAPTKLASTAGKVKYLPAG